MKRKILFALFSSFVVSAISLTCVVSSTHAEDIEALKNAFKEGFLSHKITGSEIYDEMHKYAEKPFLYVQLLKTFEKTEKGPIFVLKFKTKIDDLGRLVIYPELEISPLRRSDFKSAFYLASLLEYHKDFLDLEKLQQGVDFKLSSQHSNKSKSVSVVNKPSTTSRTQVSSKTSSPSSVRVLTLE